MSKNKILVNYLIVVISLLFCTFSANAQNHVLREVQDSAITLQIKATLAANPITKSHQIHVTTKRGYVILSGALDSRVEANTAKQIARSVQGVKGVSMTDVSIKHSYQTKRDFRITRVIEDKLRFYRLNDNPRFPDLYVKVETRNGNVYLTGNIVYRYQGLRAVEIARETADVKEVYYKFNDLDTY